MRLCFYDTETRCRVPIERGNDLYARRAEVTIVTYALGDEPVKCWDVLDEPAMPPDLKQHFIDARNGTLKFVAHQAPFDRDVTYYGLGEWTPIEAWIDTRAQAYSHALPGSLEYLGLVLGLPKEDQKFAADGKRLIDIFCIPQGADDETAPFISPWQMPAEWETFKRYAVQDTATLRTIYKLLPTVNFNEAGLALWWLDQRINRRGFGFDKDFAESANNFLMIAKDQSDRAMAKATGNVVTAATQRAKLLDYLQSKLGIDIPNMRASEIRTWLEHDDLSPEARYLLEMRLEAAKSSGSKYRRGLEVLGPGDRIRDGLQFGGAGRTGRWSGKGYQPHNMARPTLTVRRSDGSLELVPVKASYIDEVILPGIRSRAALDMPELYGGPNEAAALALRHTIIAHPGNELVVADWANIESRVLAWIAGEEWKLEAYRALDRGEGADLYKLLFAAFFGVAVEDVNDNERQSGKVSELAFGFGGGVGACVTMAATYQMDLNILPGMVLPRASADEIKKAEKAWRRAFLMNEDYLLEPDTYIACDILKQRYRAANAKIDQLRHDVDVSVKAAIRDPGRAFGVGKCVIWATAVALYIQLPSGRRIIYWNPSVETEVEQDPETGKTITYEYISYTTARGRSWRREKAWSGLFVENIVQGIACDVLRGALPRIHEDCLTVPAIKEYLATLPEWERTAISLHVHDEIALDVPKGSYPLARLIAVATAGEQWSTGLPLHAAGWVGPRYGKR